MLTATKRPRVPVRWKLLVVIGLLVLLADQWTKLLAVEHLTPGLAQHGQSQLLTPAERAIRLDAMSFGDKLSAFFQVKHPCQAAYSDCRAHPVMPGWNWRYIENPGAAWGFLAGSSASLRVPFFLGISIAAFVFILLFFRNMPDEKRILPIGLSLIFGGAVGNFVDRLHLNYVIDFIDWYVGQAHWPTFNVADAAITSGVILLGIEWLFDLMTSKKQAPKEA